MCRLPIEEESFIQLLADESTRGIVKKRLTGNGKTDQRWRSMRVTNDSILTVNYGAGTLENLPNKNYVPWNQNENVETNLF